MIQEYIFCCSRIKNVSGLKKHPSGEDGCSWILLTMPLTNSSPREMGDGGWKDW